MWKALGVWGLAVGVTLLAAVFQRLTGPTYPLRGEVQLGEALVPYKLVRSHGGTEPCEVTLPKEVAAAGYSASVVYRRYKTLDGWTRLSMQPAAEGQWVGQLPHQPPAGKLEYFVLLQKTGSDTLQLPADRSVVVRFKGAVPASFLIPHILFMFIAMLLANRAALEALKNGPRLRAYTLWSLGTLVVGGLVFGPVVQKYAFGDFWTGVPFGWDLTDNKVLIAVIGWALAAWMVYRLASHKARYWVLGAAVLLLVIYSIPHSLLGSELDYHTMQVVTGD